MIKNKYIVILIFFVVIIITNQIIVQIDINKQSYDAKIVNIAGKQRVYSQQIAKMALYAKEVKVSTFYEKDVKTLNALLDSFSESNTYLQRINNVKFKDSNIDSLFKISQPYFNNILLSSKEFIKNPYDTISLDSFIYNIKKNESHFLRSMDAVVDEYQNISENRFALLKKVQLFFITFTSIALVVLFFFIFLPLFKRNKALTFLNLELEKFKAEVKKKDKEKKNVEKILESTNKVARIGAWEVDMITNEIYWSKVTREIHGVDENFIPDMTSGINFYKEGFSRDKIQELVADSIENNSTYDVELQIVNTNNKDIWVRVIGQAEFDGDKCLKIFGVFQDINERKLQQIKLNQVNEELKAIFDSGPISIIRTNKKGIVTHFNKGAEMLLQYKKDEVVGKPPPNEMHSRSEVYERAKELSKQYNTEISGLDTITAVASKEGFEARRWTYYRKDGSSFPVQLVVSAIKNSNGEIVAYLGVATDISEIVEKEIKLNEVNEELNAIFNTGPISIVRTDLKGTITYFNKGAETLLGYKSEELVNKASPAVFHKLEEIIERGKELSKEYKKEITGFDVFRTKPLTNNFESRKWTYVRKDGTHFPVKLIVTAIKDENGDIIAFLGVATDITEEVKSQTNLLKTKNNLEAVTEQLTDQNKQLANFAHITSHNLRAPISNLNSLLGLHDLAENKEEEELIFSKFRTVIDHLSSTLNTLVEAISIKEKKKSDLELTELSFEDIYLKTIDLLSGDIIKINPTLKYDFSEIEQINYNEAYLESIFINLIGNALRYSSTERKAIIDIRTRIKKGKTQLIVSDNGLGIDLKKHGHKLFGLNKVFHRHKDSKGVGLYIVKNQIESLDGTITCISKENVGSTFVVTF